MTTPSVPQPVPTADSVFAETPPAPEPVAPPEAFTPTPAEVPGSGSEVAVPEPQTAAGLVPTIEDDWAYPKLTFEGDVLGIRVPSTQALTGYSLAMSKFVPAQTRNDITSLFIVRHLSPTSYERVMSRLMDPDDPEYTLDSIGELMSAIVKQAADALEAEQEAEKAKAAAPAVTA